MMNPAERLLEIFREWEPEEGKSIGAARGLNVGDDTSAWMRHTEAMVLVAEIDKQLSGIEADSGISVDAYRRQLPSVCSAIFQPNFPWTSGPPGNTKRFTVLTQALIDGLEMVAGFLNSHGGRDPFNAESAEDLLALLNEIEDLAMSADDLPRAERMFILALVREGQSVAKDVARFGASSPRSVTFELAGRLIAAAQHVSGKKQEKFFERARDLFRRGSTYAGKKAIDYGVTELMQALPPGQ